MGNIPEDPGICIITSMQAIARPMCLKHAASIYMIFTYTTDINAQLKRYISGFSH